MDTNSIKKDKKDFKLFYKFYFTFWIIFIIMSSTLFVLKNVNFFLYFVILYLIWYIIIFNYELSRFNKYIKIYHPKMWSEMKVGPFVNGFKRKKFVNVDEDFGDPMLTIVKKNYKKIMYLHILHIFSIPIIVLLIKLIHNLLY